MKKHIKGFRTLEKGGDKTSQVYFVKTSYASLHTDRELTEDNKKRSMLSQVHPATEY